MINNNILALGSPNIEELINHPVHITGNILSSTFIPFCSFGLSMDIFGEELPNFHVPVCRLFREKIINGQVCYEADLNQYRDRVNWKEALSSGLTLIIDTNDEYDVKNILEKKELGEKNVVKSIDAFTDEKKDNTFTLMLKTISKKSPYFFFFVVTSCFPDPVPIILEGEGHYALAAVKDIRVTEEFVGLGQGITHCQTEDFRADCVTRKLREKILQSCQCSPDYMRSYYGTSVCRESPVQFLQVTLCLLTP